MEGETKKVRERTPSKSLLESMENQSRQIQTLIAKLKPLIQILNALRACDYFTRTWAKKARKDHSVPKKR